MSLFDLGIEDGRRVLATLSDLKDGSGSGPSLDELIQGIKDAADKPVDPPPFDPPYFEGMSSPLRHVAPAVLEAIEAFKKRMVERYGQDYADGLFSRIRK